MGAIMSGLASIIGGGSAAAGGAAAAETVGAATVADTAGKAVKSISSAAELGWQPQSYLKGMDFGIGNYSGTTDFAAGESGGIPMEVGGFAPENQMGPALGAPPTASAPIASAPGISAGTFGGQTMLGDVSMNAGLDGMLGKKTTDMIAASANKFKANQVAQVPGLRI